MWTLVLELKSSLTRCGREVTCGGLRVSLCRVRVSSGRKGGSSGSTSLSVVTWPSLLPYVRCLFRLYGGTLLVVRNVYSCSSNPWSPFKQRITGRNLFEVFVHCLRVRRVLVTVVPKVGLPEMNRGRMPGPWHDPGLLLCHPFSCPRQGREC